MKKILFISNIGNGKVGSFSKSSVLAAKELGHEFHIAINYGNTERSIIAEEEKKYGIKIHKIDFIRNPFHPKNFKAYKQLLKLMKQEKYDEVHCNTPVGGLLGRICAVKAKVPQVIYMVHGFHFYKGAPLINKIIYKNVERILAKFTDVLVTINKEDYEAAKKFKLKQGGQVRFVHGVGIDINRLETFDNSENRKLAYKKDMGFKDEDIILIAIGELNKNKNVKSIVESMAMVENKKVHLIVCGRGELDAELKELTKAKNLENNVHFLGYRNDILELLSISDMFIQMSYREGLPRSIMEAMTLGVPCIVSNIRGNTDLIQDGEGGFVCEPNDINMIAEYINKLSNDAILREKMKIVNLENIKKYDMESVKEEIKAIYKI